MACFRHRSDRCRAFSLCFAFCAITGFAASSGSEYKIESKTKEVSVVGGEQIADVCFEIRNEFDKTLIVNQVKLDCSCAHYVLSSRSVEPGCAASLTISYHISEGILPQAGSLHECVVSYSVGGDKDKTVSLFAKVLRGNRISLTKSRLVWGAAAFDKQEIKIEVRPGVKVLKVAVSSPQAGVKWDQDPNNPMHFWFYRPKKPGMYFVVFTLTLDSQKQEQVVLPLLVKP